MIRRASRSTRNEISRRADQLASLGIARADHIGGIHSVRSRLNPDDVLALARFDRFARRVKRAPFPGRPVTSGHTHSRKHVARASESGGNVQGHRKHGRADARRLEKIPHRYPAPEIHSLWRAGRHSSARTDSSRNPADTFSDLGAGSRRSRVLPGWSPSRSVDQATGVWAGRVVATRANPPRSLSRARLGNWPVSSSPETMPGSSPSRPRTMTFLMMPTSLLYQ